MREVMTMENKTEEIKGDDGRNVVWAEVVEARLGNSSSNSSSNSNSISSNNSTIIIIVKVIIFILLH